ncbi:inositol monophosphatase [bacterium]|nr:inositol monophosphatase [bacterium]
MTAALKTAVSAARTAGKILLTAYTRRSDLNVTYKKYCEPVTIVDLASNDAIIKRLSRAFPKDRIVSEETKTDEDPNDIGKKPTWIIDPLDGTTNYINHIPLFAVAIARVVNGVATVAVIYDPLHDEMFTAERGRGSRLNGKRISVSNRDVARGAMLFAGRGYRTDDRRRHGKIIYALERETPYFRRLGSAAHMLAAVAAGRADAVILTGNKPWDTVAGALLVEEAGGKITDYCDRHWNVKSEDLIASNKAIHAHVVGVTKDKTAC